MKVKCRNMEFKTASQHTKHCTPSLLVALTAKRIHLQQRSYSLKIDQHSGFSLLRADLLKPTLGSSVVAHSLATIICLEQSLLHGIQRLKHSAAYSIVMSG